MLALGSSLLLLVAATKTTAASDSVAQQTVEAMIRRYVPAHADDFMLETMPSQSGSRIFEIEGKRNKIVLRGSDGVALASGFNWYLKHVAFGQISNRGDQLGLSGTLPLPASKIRKVSPFRIVNYLNYCTFCYSAAFWDWSQWERQIDMMAMSGVNTPLMTVGNEIVWERVLRQLGYSQADIDRFIPGCAFTAWWLMGNLEGEGGPVPEHLIQEESDLAKRILDRMRAYGMHPILQGFTGVVPSTLGHYLPGAHIVDQGNWVGGYHRPSVLSPLDPAFPKIAALWYSEQAKLYGAADFYGGDLFHEGGKTDGLDLAECAKAVQREMSKENPQAIWVLQGWGSNPPKQLLEATDPQHVVVESLRSYPQDVRTQDYSGRPWTFCMVNNFGGHETLGGSLQTIAEIPSHLVRADNHGNVGIGVLDEGLDANPAVYDLFADVVWESKDIDLTTWARDFAHRRYGAEDDFAENFWLLMATDLLGNQSENLLCAKPKFGIKSASTWGDATQTHDVLEMIEAARLLLSCHKKFKYQTTYRSDCIEAFRQMFNDYGVQLYNQMSQAYGVRNLPWFLEFNKELVQVIEDCDLIYSSGEYTLLGRWLAAARAKGSTKAEQDLLERNARQLVTLWTPAPSELTDYSYRQWGGLTKDYYLPRWQNFITWASEVETLSGITVPHFDDSAQWVAWVKVTDQRYDMIPVGDAVETSLFLWSKYAEKFEEAGILWALDQSKRWGWNLADAPQNPAGDDDDLGRALGHGTISDRLLQWDVTDKLRQLEGGPFRVTVEFRSGQNGIKIARAELVRKSEKTPQGVSVSVDEHLGRCGNASKNNVYSLDPGPLDPQSTYTLRLSVSGDGGNDAQGWIFIHKR